MWALLTSNWVTDKWEKNRRKEKQRLENSEKIKIDKNKTEWLKAKEYIKNTISFLSKAHICCKSHV